MAKKGAIHNSSFNHDNKLTINEYRELVNDKYYIDDCINGLADKLAWAIVSLKYNVKK